MRNIGLRRVGPGSLAAVEWHMGNRFNSAYCTAVRNPSRRYRPRARAFLPVLMVASVAVHPISLRADGTEWCQTVSAEATASVEARGACPTHGVCDVPAVRNAAIPDEDGPIVTIRLKFNVFREDDGTNPVLTEESISAQVAQLQADFLPYRIQFATVLEFINDSTFRDFDFSTQEAEMKHPHADQPENQLNIYVVDMVGASFGVAVFPWTSPRSDLGGIVIDKDFADSPTHILSHEVGHIFGLWHTHHGVSEVEDCSVCYERADGSNGDTSGDRCADTASTPFNNSCLPPDAVDCKGVAFPFVAPVNFMGANLQCQEDFTGQQAGRMHCWIADALACWVAEPTEPCEPPIPTLSAWALAVESLALAAAASVVLIRRRSTPTSS